MHQQAQICCIALVNPCQLPNPNIWTPPWTFSHKFPYSSPHWSTGSIPIISVLKILLFTLHNLHEDPWNGSPPQLDMYVWQGGSMPKIQHLRLFFLKMGAQTPLPLPSFLIQIRNDHIKYCLWQIFPGEIQWNSGYLYIRCITCI